MNLRMKQNIVDDKKVVGIYDNELCSSDNKDFMLKFK